MGWMASNNVPGELYTANFDKVYLSGTFNSWSGESNPLLDDDGDGIWEGTSQIYDWGFVVEMKIPYKSIKYDKNLTEWGLDFDRWRSYNKEDIYWCEYEQSEGQRVSKFGKLIFEEFKPTITGLNLEIYPVGIAKSTF